MIIEIDDLKLTLDYFKTNKVDIKLFFTIIQTLNSFVELGFNETEIIKKSLVVLGVKKVKSKNQLSEIYYCFMKDYTEAIKSKKERIIFEHLIIYDKKIERELRNPQIRNINYYKKVKIEKLLSCLDTMRQKETLLGLHRKKTRIVINNKVRFEKQKISAELINIDTTALTMPEKVELLELLQKAKGDVVQIPDHFDYEKMNAITDLEFEEVSKLPPIHSPIEVIKEIEIKKQIEGAKNINQLKNSLVEKFKKMAKENFENAGIKQK